MYLQIICNIAIFIGLTSSPLASFLSSFSTPIWIFGLPDPPGAIWPKHKGSAGAGLCRNLPAPSHSSHLLAHPHPPIAMSYRSLSPISGYTGHIPGERWVVGKSVGRSRSWHSRLGTHRTASTLMESTLEDEAVMMNGSRVVLGEYDDGGGGLDGIGGGEDVEALKQENADGRRGSHKEEEGEIGHLGGVVELGEERELGGREENGDGFVDEEQHRPDDNDDAVMADTEGDSVPSTRRSKRSAAASSNGGRRRGRPPNGGSTRTLSPVKGEEERAQTEVPRQQSAGSKASAAGRADTDRRSHSQRFHNNFARSRTGFDAFDTAEPGWWSEGQALRNLRSHSLLMARRDFEAASDDSRQSVGQPNGGLLKNGGDNVLTGESSSVRGTELTRDAGRDYDHFTEVPAPGYSGHLTELHQTSVGRPFGAAAKESRRRQRVYQESARGTTVSSLSSSSASGRK